jgi:hypothetical protein
MIEHFALKFCEACGNLCRHIDAVLIRETQDRPKKPEERQLSEGYTRFVGTEALGPIVPEIQRLGFDSELINRTKRLFGRLCMPQGRSWTAETLLDSLIDIRRAIGLELNKHKFAYLLPPNDQYFEQEKLFGENVYIKFPSARREIRDAGNCLAMALWTAGVFHSMRVAEYGMRALCYDRRIILPNSKPIDLSTWQDMLKELERTETKIQQYPRTLAREAQLSFYHEAMMEIRRFKNLYRNKVMHSREYYDERQAVGAFHHVKAFMEILSLRVGEGERTPEIWKGPKWAKGI